MSEAEQDEASQQVAELLVELTDVRKKHDQLDVQNLRVTDNLRKAIEERDKAVSQLESLRVEYLAAKESANTNSDNAAALIEQLAEMTASRNNFERLCKEWRIEFNAINAKKDSLQVQLSQWQIGHDAIKKQLQQMTAERDAALADVRLQLAARSVIIAERDAAERERTESRAEVVQLRAERDAVSEQLARCKEEVDMFKDENDSLRDFIQKLRAKQVHDNLPGLLLAIQLAAEQARELI